MSDTAFHEVRFPLRISLGAAYNTERRTEIVSLASGFEERNTRWAHSRRQYDAGQGVRSIDDLHEVLDFFEERRGMLHGFRWHDRIDGKSCRPRQTTSAFDQAIGTSTGSQTDFQLIKTYGSTTAPYTRAIRKPVAGSVKVAVGGVEQTLDTDFTVDEGTGIITFIADPPSEGAEITAGFVFDVPVRFATDRLDITLSTFDAGEIPSIPLTEIRT